MSYILCDVYWSMPMAMDRPLHERGTLQVYIIILIHMETRTEDGCACILSAQIA